MHSLILIFVALSKAQPTPLNMNTVASTTSPTKSSVSSTTVNNNGSNSLFGSTTSPIVVSSSSSTASILSYSTLAGALGPLSSFTSPAGLSANMNRSFSTPDPSDLFGKGKILGFGAFSIFPGFKNPSNYLVDGRCTLWLDPCAMRSQIKTELSITDAYTAQPVMNLNLMGVAHNQSCEDPVYNSIYRRFPQYRTDIEFNQLTMLLVQPARSNISQFNFAFSPRNKPASWVFHHPVTKEGMFCCTFEYFQYPTCDQPAPSCPRTCLSGLVIFFGAAFTILSITLGCFIRHSLGPERAAAHCRGVTLRPRADPQHGDGAAESCSSQTRASEILANAGADDTVRLKTKVARSELLELPLSGQFVMRTSRFVTMPLQSLILSLALLRVYV